MRPRLAAAALGLALLLTACAPAQVPGSSSGPESSLPQSQEDDPGWRVETHWDKLTPYDPPEQVARRYYEGYTDRLIPAGDYGPLYPFDGGELAGEELPPGWVWADREELRGRYALPSAFQSFSKLVADRLGHF